MRINSTNYWKEKTDLIKRDYSQKLFPEKVQKKNRLILKHPKNQNPLGKVSLVKRINEGYFLSHLFLF